jgi:carbamoyl-phosphate synthase large subunit
VKELCIFVRQPFTESGNSEKEVVQGVLDVLRKMNGNPYKLLTPTGFEAQSESTFREAYERTSGKPFTPQDFRATRLEYLKNADVMLVIRTGLSESGSFEIAYNIFGGRRIPMLFAVWDKAPIKTTLLQELQEIADATYITFASPEELEAPLREFLGRARRRRSVFRWLGGAGKKSIGIRSVLSAKPTEHLQRPIGASHGPEAAMVSIGQPAQGSSKLC